ncbi:unnamed protein product, partial [Phaeothamnion confervicola]
LPSSASALLDAVHFTLILSVQFPQTFPCHWLNLALHPCFYRANLLIYRMLASVNGQSQYGLSCIPFSRKLPQLQYQGWTRHFADQWNYIDATYAVLLFCAF